MQEWATQPLGDSRYGGRIKQLQSESRGGKGEKSGGGVIDCGVSRAVETQLTNPKRCSGGLAPWKQDPTLDYTTAVKDWRFGAVNVEGVDMASTDWRRGESSAAEDRPADVELGTPENLGRVTKARFEPVDRKNTEVGWGIVHLYRDGEETFGLGAPPESDGDEKEKETLGEGEVEGEEGDCTTICVPAVPSFFTPSDFMGWVGPKTRDQVSHFRMVMTGRVNRYLVLMKFRDNEVAKKWKEEWDGKLFFDLEVSVCSC